MSMEALNAVFASDLPPTARLVALAIADQINGDGAAWPGTEHISKRTGLHRASVLRAVASVEASGIFEVTRSVGRVNVYRLSPVAQSDPSHSATRRTERLDQSQRATPPVAESDGTRRTVRPEPKVTQKESNMNPIAREPDAEIAESHRVPESPSVATAQPAQEPAAVAPQSSLYANTTNLPAKGGKSRKTANPAVSGDATHCAKAFAVLRQIKAGSERAASASTVAKFAAAVFEPLLADYSRDEVLLVLDWLHEDPADKWRYGCANLPAGYTHAFRRQFPTFLEAAKRWVAVR